jgi:hypothetical protein
LGRPPFLEKWTIDLGKFESAIDNSPPSFRDIFTNYEILLSGGTIGKDETKLLEMMPKDFMEVSFTTDPNVIISKLHKEILNSSSKKKADLLIELAEIDYRCSLNSLKVLQIQTGFLKLYKILNTKV